MDQINVSPSPATPTTRTGDSSSRDTRAGGTGNAVANTALGPVHATTARSGRSRATEWRALAVDAFVQDYLEGAEQPDARGRPALRLLAALARQAQQHRRCSIRAFYNPAAAAVIDRRTGRSSAATASTASCCRATASRRRRRAQIEAAGNPAYASPVPRPARRVLGDASVRRSSRGWGWPTSINPKTVVRLGGGIFHTAGPAQRLDAARRQPADPVQGGRDERRRSDQPTGATSADLPVHDDHAGPRSSSTRPPTTGAPRSSASCPATMAVDVTLRRADGHCTCSASATSTSSCRGPSRPTPA